MDKKVNNLWKPLLLSAVVVFISTFIIGLVVGNVHIFYDGVCYLFLCGLFMIFYFIGVGTHIKLKHMLIPPLAISVIVCTLVTITSYPVLISLIMAILIYLYAFMVERI